MTKSFTKLKHQVKSSRYYIFWGAATVAVMAGQIYVGNGYRGMSQSVKDLTEMIEIRMELEYLENQRYQREIIPLKGKPLGDFNPDDYIIWKTIDEQVLNVN